MSVGAKIWAGLRAVLMLAGIWAALGVVAWATGVLPALEISLDPDDEPVVAENEDAGTPDAMAPDAAVVATSVVDDPDPASDDSVVPQDPNADDPTDGDPADPDLATGGDTESPSIAAGRSAPLARARICEDSEEATVGVGSVVGDARPEWIVACEGVVHILGHDPAGGSISRLARVRRTRDGASRPARPMVGDVDGDGRDDLVVGFVDIDTQGGPSGGALVLVPGLTSGALGTPQPLAQIAANAVALAELNGRDGIDLVAVNWADGFGRRPSDLWVIAGGASPARVSRERLRDDGVSVTTAHIDDDDRLDVLAVDATGARWFAGGAGARLGSANDIELVGGRRAVSGDLDGDGRDEAILVGDGLFVLEGGEAKPIDAPHAVREVLVADVNSDALPDLVLLTRQRVAALVRDGEGYREELLVALPGVFRPLDFALTTLTGGSRALLILGRTRLGIELLVVPVTGGVTVDAVAEVEAAVDAPLVLDVTIP